MKLATKETYATLCIYSRSDASIADTIRKSFSLEPSRLVVNNSPPRWLKRPRGMPVFKYAWFLSSKRQVRSRDVERHIQWLLDQLGEKFRGRSLERLGYVAKISCYWSSEGAGGGPVLSVALLRRVASSELPLEFDVYLVQA